MKLLSCVRCDGFVPPLASICPHCSARVEGLLPLVTRAAIAVVGGSAMSMTLMACYGGPPCEDTGIDADNDSYVTSTGATGGCFDLDCNDDDATIHPGADDTEGDGIDQNCDGVDGTPPPSCNVDSDCPAALPVCDQTTFTCEASPGEPAGEGEGEGEGENP